MREKHTGAVKFQLDSKKLPKLTLKQRHLLREKNGEAINYTDIPSQAKGKWTRPGALVPLENKQQVTLRLDADVLTFFKNTGKRYQSRINAVLREYIASHRKAS